MDTKTRIFLAARRRFERGGIENVSMRSLAKDVGVTAMALYRHYPDKDAIVHALTLDALEVRRAVVCGLSMGGYIAFELLRRHPDRVRALILCDTRASADAADARQRRDELAGLATREGPDAVGERLIPNLLAASTRADRPEVLEQCRAMGRRYTVAGMAGALEAMRDRVDSTDLLSKIAVPTLVMVGAEDPTSPPAVMKVMADAIPGARYVVIPGAGHVSPLEQPLTSSRVIADFLDGLPTSTA